MRDINFGGLPIFAGLDRVDLAKLIPCFVREEFPAGAVLFRQGEQGESFYIVVAGTVQILLHHSQGEREVARLSSGECLGEMALLTGAPRTADAIAATDITVLRLAKKDFDEILDKHHTLAVHFAALLASRAAASATRKSAADGHAESPAGAAPYGHSETVVDKPRQRLLRYPKLATLLVTAVLCTASTWYLLAQGVARDHIVILELLLAATIIWSFDIVSYHAVSLALPLAAVLFDIAKPDKAFAGFAKSSWFMALGVFALMAAISKTGLLYRLSLQVLRRFPPNYLGQTSALALAGMLLTPIIPSSYGRAILASPIALTLTETLRLEKGGKGSVGIAMACLLGFGHMSFMFMNGTADCLFVAGLMPAEAAGRLTWSSWFWAALPFGLIFFTLSMISIFVLFHPRELIRLSPEVVEAQLGTLGPVTYAEKVTLTVGLLTLAGFATVKWHGIDEAWVAMLSFLVLFASKVLDDAALKEMDWSFLIAYGAMTGFGNLIQTTGVADLCVGVCQPAATLLQGHVLALLLIVSLAVHVLRCFLPLTPALLICMLSIVPLAAQQGVDPLVIALVALASANPWLLQHQNTIYRGVWKATGGKLFKHEKIIPYALLHVVIVLLAVTLAIPWWYALGMLG